jgi:hypothetical protein
MAKLITEPTIIRAAGKAEQAVVSPKGEWVRYRKSRAGGAEYIVVCVPAFSLDIVHRDP